MRYFLIAIAFLCGAVLPAGAQTPPTPEALVRGWRASQEAMGSNIRRVALHEETIWGLDGPFGIRTLRREAEVSGVRGAERWDREILRVEVNGRGVPRARWDQADQQRLRMVGPPAEAATRAVTQLHQLLRNVIPAGDVAPERVEGGIAAWRVELVPRGRRETLQRLTLWFSREQGHLVRSRVVFQGRRRGGTPLIVTTLYRRHEGLDVPRRRHLEGSTQMRRRLRTYTLLFSFEATYSDYRFFREG